MECGPYTITFDRTGFPLVRRCDWGFSISLFPVSKFQFERFLSDHGPRGALFTDDWYRNILALNPRRAWQDPDDRPWELFLTGLSLDEIEPFLKYLGTGFRLPEPAEWKIFLEVTGELISLKVHLECNSKEMSRPAASWVGKGLFPLSHEGLLEWVVDKSGTYCVGRPFGELLPNTFEPDILRDVNFECCRGVVGFRTVEAGE